MSSAAGSASDPQTRADDPRHCALCGAVDADQAWPVPTHADATSQCPRCASVRFLWHDLAAARATDVPAPASHL